MNIKKYLEGYKIETADKLVSHIAELKTNTYPDFKLISELVHHLEVGYNDFGIYKDDVITSPSRGEKEMFKLQENKDTQEKFTKCVNYIYREKPKRPKNVIVSITEKVNSNKNNTSYLKQPKIKDTSLKELKEATINATNLNFDIKDILDIISCDTKEDIYRLVEKQIAERDKLNIYPLTPEECFKKENISSKKEGIGVKQNQTAYKETEGKLFYELDWGFITQMAERMASNKKESKYALWNWKKPMTPKGIEDLKQATLRHLLEVLEGRYEDDGRPFGHIEAIADNMMMINYQIRQLNKS